MRGIGRWPWGSEERVMIVIMGDWCNHLHITIDHLLLRDLFHFSLSEESLCRF